MGGARARGRGWGLGGRPRNASPVCCAVGFPARHTKRETECWAGGGQGVRSGERGAWELKPTGLGLTEDGSRWNGRGLGWARAMLRWPPYPSGHALVTSILSKRLTACPGNKVSYVNVPRFWWTKKVVCATCHDGIGARLCVQTLELVGLH